MLNPLKCVFEEYQPLLMKMAIDLITMALAVSNLGKFYDVQMMFGLTCLLPILIIVHSSIKFAQLHNVFVCDFIAIISICKMSANSLRCTKILSQHHPFLSFLPFFFNHVKTHLWIIMMESRIEIA
jgi:hypothetical protein